MAKDYAPDGVFVAHFSASKDAPPSCLTLDGRPREDYDHANGLREFAELLVSDPDAARRHHRNVPVAHLLELLALVETGECKIYFDVLMRFAVANAPPPDSSAAIGGDTCVPVADDGANAPRPDLEAEGRRTVTISEKEWQLVQEYRRREEGER